MTLRKRGFARLLVRVIAYVRPHEATRPKIWLVHQVPMNTFTDRVARSIGRHFVSLSCVQHPPNGGEMRIHVFSGFVVDVAGQWFYVTAGHILRDIQKAMDCGSIFDIWRLGDQTAGNRFNNAAIPYAFDPNHWFVLEDADVGLDYATTHLGGLYRQQLETGGVTAIAKNAWSDPLAEHDHWALVGIPTETVSYDGKTVISARIVMAPLLPTDAPHLPSNGPKTSSTRDLPMAQNSSSAT